VTFAMSLGTNYVPKTSLLFCVLSEEEVDCISNDGS
jgi:hypothetical protein